MDGAEGRAFLASATPIYRDKKGTGMDQVTESLLVRVWHSQILRDKELITAGGESFRVIYPGRTNSESGPDFHHAIIATGEGELRGDVELHVRSSGWQAHGHHRDPRYNGLILHVVMWHNQYCQALVF